MKICGDFILNGSTLTHYSGQDPDLTIPDGITKIDRYVFFNAKNLVRISLPESVTDIGGYSGCRSLEAINIPNKVTAIPNHAFNHCTSLTSIALPGGVKKIGQMAFCTCKKLTSISLPDAITKLPEMVFFECTHLKSVILPKNLTEIGDSAFSGCIRLESLILPDRVMKIGKSAFLNCKKLKEIVLPEGIKEIQDSTFSACVGLRSIYLPPTVQKIHKNSFLLCRDLTIHGVAGSFAETFAKKEKIQFSAEPLPAHAEDSGSKQPPHQKAADAPKTQGAASRSITKLAPSPEQQTGKHIVEKCAERIVVDGSWSMEIPVGYTYCMDPTLTAKGIFSGIPHLLQVQSWYDENIQFAYESNFNLTVYGDRFETNFIPGAPLTSPENAVEIQRWENLTAEQNPIKSAILGQPESVTYQLRQTPEIAVYYTFIVRTKQETSGDFHVYLPKKNGFYNGQFSIFIEAPSTTRENLIRAWLSSIEPLAVIL